MSISKARNLFYFTDHKPLEKMGHLHNKTMNRLQASLLEHNFVIQYKKGAIMPADYLSCLPSTDEKTWQRSHSALTLSNLN